MKQSMLVVIFVATCAMAIACSPIGSDTETSATNPVDSTATPHGATLEPLRIVTPTPVDPRQIPSTPTVPSESITVPSTYVVVEGDSLYSIAIKFQIELAEIVALNGLRDPNDIVVGQELQLPVPDQP